MLPQRPVVIEPETVECGDITAEALANYDGSDPWKPIYLAVRGVVYDVSNGRDFYGPGGGYAVFAGKEVARALALMSTDPGDCNDNLEGLTEEQLKTLEDWDRRFQSKYGVAGKIVPPLELTLQQLSGYDGTDPSKPILLAIRGVIFDVSKGKDFYGPDGMYPFAGRECARAFAMMSTRTEDCNEDLEGMSKTEMSFLAEWEAKFNFKYPVVGRLVKGEQ